MSRESLTSLSRLTGKSVAKVRQLVSGLQPLEESESRGTWYESKQALPLIYGANTDTGFDLEEERARLAHHNANKSAMEEKELSGQLVRMDDIHQVWENRLVAFKSKLLALPPKTASRVIRCETFAEAKVLLDKAVREALKELAEEQRKPRKATKKAS